MLVLLENLNQLSRSERQFIVDYGAFNCVGVRLKRNFKNTLFNLFGCDACNAEEIAFIDSLKHDRYYLSRKNGGSYFICNDDNIAFKEECFEDIVDNPSPSLFKERTKHDRKTEACLRRDERRDVFNKLYIEGDNADDMMEKMRTNGYPNISVQVVYKVACECGVKMEKPKRGYDYGNKYRGRYKAAYDIYGNRTMVRIDKIDNINWFASKKAHDDFKSN